MRQYCAIFLISLLALTTGCDRLRSKETYLEKGDADFAKSKWEEASINYRRAIRKDARYGEAWRKLGLTQLRQNRPADAYRSLNRAVELLPDNDEVKVQLADIALRAYLVDSRRPKFLYEQMGRLSRLLLAKNPNSYDGLRLNGYIAVADGNLAGGITAFEKANQIKPMQPELTLALAQLLMRANRGPEGELLALQLAKKEKAYGPIFDVLYAYYVSTKRLGDAENIIRTKVENNPKQPMFRMQLAAHYFSNQKTGEVQAALKPLLENTQDFPAGALLVGDFYARARNFPEALKHYDDYARRNPKEVTTTRKRVTQILLAQGKQPEAEKLVEEILKADPKDDFGLSLRAGMRMQTAKAESVRGAIADLETLANKTPENVAYKFNLARAYYAARNLAQAQNVLQDAIKRRRDYLPARLLLAQVHLESGRPADALRTTQEILQADPKNVRARTMNAAGLMGTGKMSEAEVDLRELVKEAPDFADAQLQYGLLHLAQSRFKDAEQIFRKFYEPGGSDPRPLRGLVETLLAQKEGEKALQLLAEEKVKAPNSLNAKTTYAATALRIGKYDIALKSYSDLLAQNPSNPELHFVIGETYRRMGDLQKAITSVQKARELAPKDARTSMYLASLMEVSGKPLEAKANYESVLKMQPDNPIAMNNLAFALADTGGNLEEAMKLATKALEKVPDQPNFADTLGYVYLKKGQVDSALQVFANLVRKYPKDPTFRYHLALASLQKGDKARAKTEAEAALQNGPAQMDAEKIKSLLTKIGG